MLLHAPSLFPFVSSEGWNPQLIRILAQTNRVASRASVPNKNGSAVSLLGQTGSFRLIRVLSLAAIQCSLPALPTYGRFNFGRSVVLELKLGRARSQRRQ